MAAPIFDHLIAAIHHGSPYAGFDPDSRPLDVQGWSSESPIFDRLIASIRPALILEVGSWKGASAIHMAARLKAHGITSAIVCVDTWLGSENLWRNPETRASLALRNGYPSIYYTFLANVMKTGHADVIVPLPLTSTSAARLLKALRITADLIYVDAHHDAASVLRDLNDYWSLLSPRGAMFGDDYAPGWPGVVEAVHAFAERSGIEPEIHREKWILRPTRPTRVSISP